MTASSRCTAESYYYQLYYLGPYLPTDRAKLRTYASSDLTLGTVITECLEQISEMSADDQLPGAMGTKSIPTCVSQVVANLPSQSCRRPSRS